MKNKIIIFLTVLFVLYFAVSYKQAKYHKMGTDLITDAFYGRYLDVKNAIEEGAPSDYILLLEEEEREYSAIAFNLIQAAASGGNIDIIHHALKLGFDIDSPTAENWTPLFIATRDGRAEAAQFLIVKGANVNATTNLGATPLIMAITQKYPDEKDRENLLAYLLKKGADPNKKDSLGNPPLFYAVAVNRPDILQMLFDYGANLSDKEKKELISLAKKKNDDSAKKIISILKKH